MSACHEVVKIMIKFYFIHVHIYQIERTILDAIRVYLSEQRVGTYFRYGVVHDFLNLTFHLIRNGHERMGRKQLHLSLGSRSLRGITYFEPLAFSNR